MASRILDFLSSSVFVVVEIHVDDVLCSGKMEDLAKAVWFNEGRVCAGTATTKWSASMESSEEFFVEENSMELCSAVEMPTTKDGVRRLNNGKKMREEARRARHRTYRRHSSGSAKSRSGASRFLFQCLARSPVKGVIWVILEGESIPSWVAVASSESVVTSICPSWKSAPSVELFGWEQPLVKNWKRTWINRATTGAVSVPLHSAGCWDCSG